MIFNYDLFRVNPMAISESELKEMARKLIEMNKDRIVEYLVNKGWYDRAAKIQLGLYIVDGARELATAIEQGWKLNELIFKEVEGYVVEFRAPNNLSIRVLAEPYSDSAVDKEMWKKYLTEYKTFKKIGEIKELQAKVKNLEKELKDCKAWKEITMKELNSVRSRYGDLMEFIREKGLVREFVEWVKKAREEGIEEEILEEYGFAEEEEDP